MYTILIIQQMHTHTIQASASIFEKKVIKNILK